MALNFLRRKQPVLTEEEIAQGGADKRWWDLPGNIIPSAGRVVRDVATGIGGLSPIAPKQVQSGIGRLELRAPPTLTAIAGLGTGIVQKAIPGRQSQEGKAEAVGQFFGSRYGSPARIKQTLINDPVGIGLDASTILTGGATAVPKLGKVASVVSKVTTPVNLAAKTIGRTSNVAGKGASNILGFTTGVGAQTIKEAFSNPSPALTAAMRGKTSEVNIVGKAMEGVRKLKVQRGDEYRARLDALSTDETRSMDISPILTAKGQTPLLDSELTRFGARRAEDGSIDWSRSTVSSPSDKVKLQQIDELFKEWGTQKGDRTPAGMDLLRRRLGSYGMESNEGIAIASALKSNVRDMLVKQVPDYEKMTGGYAQASRFIQDVERLTGDVTVNAREAAMTKLSQALREDKKYRAALIKDMEKMTGVNVTPMIAGSALNSWVPRALANRLFAAGTVGTGLLNPGVLVGLAAVTASLSPRIVGEIVRALGYPARKATDITAAIQAIKTKVPGIGKMTPEQLEQAIFQAGRARDVMSPVQRPEDEIPASFIPDEPAPVDEFQEEEDIPPSFIPDEDVPPSFIPDDDIPDSFIPDPVPISRGKPKVGETTILSTKVTSTIPPKLRGVAKSIVTQESGGKYSAVGIPTRHGRALGKYQIIPKFHFSKIGLNPGSAQDQQKYLKTPQLQDTLFAKLFNELSSRYKGNARKIVAAYYGGDGAAQIVGTKAADKPQKGGMPSINQYVRSVLSRA